MYKMKSDQRGVTLIELLIALTILGVLFTFALPAYQATVDTSEEGVVSSNIYTIEMFQEDFFLRNGNYARDLDNIAEIEAAIGWNPRANDGITYAIAAGAAGDTFYDVTATHPDGWTVCVRFPNKIRCP